MSNRARPEFGLELRCRTRHQVRGRARILVPRPAQRSPRRKPELGVHGSEPMRMERAAQPEKERWAFPRTRPEQKHRMQLSLRQEKQQGGRFSVFLKTCPNFGIVVVEVLRNPRAIWPLALSLVYGNVGLCQDRQHRHPGVPSGCRLLAGFDACLRSVGSPVGRCLGKPAFVNRRR
ncbi:MAG: hypothetical protein ABIL25_03080 [candidate division WOR-3 bacterium]